MSPPRWRRLLRLPFGVHTDREAADEEIRFHLEERAARFEREGLAPDEAMRAARLRFGDVDAVRGEVEELTRRRRRTMEQHDRVDDARRDVAFAARQIVRNPGFSAIAVLTIALGIGATTSIFSVVDGVMLRPLPFDEPDELVMIWADVTRRAVVLPDKRREWLSWPDYADVRDEVPALEAVAAFQGWFPTVTGVGETAEQVGGSRITHQMFSDVLGVEPTLGRGFRPEEDTPDGALVVLISDGFWRRAFGADPDILNRTIRLDDQPVTVIGVMPADFHPPAFLGQDVWSPLQLDMSNGGGRGGAYLRAVGRLRDVGSLDLAQSQAGELALRLEQEYPESNTDVGFNVYPLQYDLVQQSSTTLWVLFGAVGFVLLIACVNVANLLLARGTGRAAELAVRTALGAGRARVLAQLMTESLLLALGGGVLGVGLAYLGTDVLVRLAPSATPLLDQVAVDGRILGFAALVTVLTGTLFGILPAIRAAGTHPVVALRESGRSGALGGGSTSLRDALVVGQVSLALILLVGAGLLVRSLQNLREVDLGFDPEGVLAIQVQLPSVRYPDAAARLSFFVPLEERLAALPGVTAVGSITNLPLANFDGDTRFFAEGAPPPRPGNEPTVWLRRITPGYPQAIGLRLVSGRWFNASDDAEANRVVIVNQTLERDYFDGRAVGKRININRPDAPVWREIVGVAEDIKNFGIRAESRNAMYIPYAQSPTTVMFTALRTAVDPSSLVNAVRGEVAALDPGIALARVQSMDELVDRSLAGDRFTTSLLGGFALIALFLAVVGLYGVVSYSVSTRVREMGVRIALGAPRADIRILVLRWAFGLVVAGVVLGGLGALAATRFLQGLLFGVGATDPATFAAVCLVMLGAALLASLVPAVRATRVDPIMVLKAE